MTNDEMAKLEDKQTKGLAFVQDIRNKSFNNMLWNDIGEPVTQLEYLLQGLSEL